MFHMTITKLEMWQNLHENNFFVEIPKIDCYKKKKKCDL